jgi:hypothetical protein
MVSLHARHAFPSTSTEQEPQTPSATILYGSQTSVFAQIFQQVLVAGYGDVILV